ncbi:MAG TPA: outer membrane protein assembly factor BamB [Cellvibrionaceae bacterium]
MRRLVTAVLVLALGGCSVFSKKDGTEPMELVKFESTAELKRVWQTSVGSGQGVGFTRITPVIDGDIMYAADYKGRLFALNRLTGKQLWSKHLKETLAGGVGLSQQLLLLGTDNGQVVALDRDNGSELWRVQVPGEIMSIPSGNDDVVAVQTMDGRLTVLDAGTGERLWFYESPPPRLTLRGRAAPVVSSSAVYAAFANGRFMAFNPQNGLILWEQRVAMPRGRSDLDKMVDIMATPLLRDGILYVNGFQGRLMAISRGSGRPLWAVDSSSHQELALLDGVIYLTDSDSKVLARDAGNGGVIWTNEQMQRRQLNGPQVLGEYVVVADAKGYIHVMDKATGEFADRERIDRSGVRVPLLVADNLLYVLSNNGKLAAYRVAPR